MSALKRYFVIFLILFIIMGDLLAQWKPAGGPYASTFYPIYTVANIDNILFAGTRYGIYTSQDNGNSWIQNMSQFSDQTVKSIVVSGATVIAGCDGSGGIYKSEDNGASWNMQSGLRIHALGANESTILASTDLGVYISTDRGDSWEVTSSEIVDFIDGNFAWAFTFLDSTWYAATAKGIFRTADDGNSWTLVENGYFLSVAACGGSVFASALNDGIYRSDDGASWSRVTRSILNVKTLTCFEDTIFAANQSGDVSLGTNKGTDWISLSKLAHEVLTVHFNGSYLFAGTDESGIFRYNSESGNWNKTNSGITSAFANIKAIAAKNGTLFAGIGSGGLIKSINNGENWVNTNLTENTTALLLDDEGFYAGTFEGGIYRSADYGITWNLQSANVGGGNLTTIVKYSNHLIAGSYGDGVFMSVDQGITWSEKNFGLSNKYVGDILIIGEKVIVGTDGGLFSSEDNGATWISAGQGITNNHIEVLAANGANVYAGTSGGGLFRSEDQGVNWVEVINNQGDYHSVYDIVFNGSNIFIGTNNGIYVSNASDYLWTSVNDERLDLSVKSLCINNSILFADTEENGIWFRPLIEMISTVKINNKAILNDLTISHEINYKLDRLIINYNIPFDSYTSLSIKDIKGECIANLVNGIKAKGMYHTQISTGRLSSGVYHSVLKVDNRTIGKPLIILK